MIGVFMQLSHYLSHFFLLGIMIGLIGCDQMEDQSYAPTPKTKLVTFPVSHDPARLTRTGPDTCIECHAQQVADWKSSHHAHANRPVSLELDRAAFTPARSIEESGVVYRLDLSPENTFQLTVQHADGSKELYELYGVIGHTPIRQYLAKLDGNKFQTISASYDVINDRWVDVFAGEQRIPGEWGHWTGQGMNWNANCAYCHTTEYQKNYDFATDSYHSTWIQQGLACASCHGNLDTHLRAAQSGNYEPTTITQLDTEQMEAVCASCHSRRDQLTADAFKPGDPYHDHFDLSLPDQAGLYHPDGQILDEDFVYGSFQMSRMHHAGVSCMDCHNPHSLEPILPIENNMLCMRCHQTGTMEAPIIEPVAHSHHAEGSLGNRCVECHMPKTTYMQVDPRADHGFLMPDPLMTQQLGIPNACNSCHTDESVDWAVQWMDIWYPDSAPLARQRQRAQTIDLAYQYSADAIPGLVKLLEDEVIAAWRATYLGLLANYLPNQRIEKLIQSYADDSSPMVRSRVARSIQADATASSLSLDLLRDESRNVRLAAARSIAAADTNIADPRVTAEWDSYLKFQSDRPQSLFFLAQKAVREDQPDEVLKYVDRAITLDQRNAEAYHQSAILLSQCGSLEAAMQKLYQGWEIAPDNPQFPYSLGLLAAERGDLERAVGFLEETVAMEPRFYRAWYNLSLAYQRLGRMEDATRAMQRAQGQ